MRKFLLVATMFGILDGPAMAAGLEGDWLVAEGTAVIRIAPCGDSLCGRIAWTPAPAQDGTRPDSGKQEESPVGTKILIDMKPSGDQRWNGQIYNPEDGKTYTGHLALITPDVLKVEGCLLVFCSGESWTRTSSDPAARPGAAGGHPGENVRPASGAPSRPR